MPIPSIFPHYMQGENRVTVAMLAVFERISIQLLEQIFRYAAGDDAFSLVRFVSQPPLSGTRRRPDGEIVGSCRYLFEVKRVPNALEREQLEAYLTHFVGEGMNKLFAVTPDLAPPPVVAEIGDDRLVWFNFLRLSQAIDQVLDEDAGRIADRDAFLLRELQAHFEEGGLLSLGQDVAVVAAREAYPLYLTHGVYACQPASKRSFRPEITRIGFYANGAIQREVPRILLHESEFEMTEESFAACGASNDPHRRDLGVSMRQLMQAKPEWYEEAARVQAFLLTPPDDPDTQILNAPVVNVTKAATGRGFPYVLGTRYTTSAALRKQPRDTAELAAFGG